jgi:ATP/ADP translocase
MKQLLERHLKIYTHETANFIWISSIFFTIFFVTAIFRNYVDASFLKRYGPEYIPWMLVINAILTFFVLGVVDKLAKRYKDHYLLSGLLSLYALTTTANFFMVKADMSIVYPILYQLLYLLDSILLVYLWNIAGDLFDARQGKRIFPLITAAQVLGATMGSYFTKPLTLMLGPDPTLLVFAAVCFVTGLYLFKTGARLLGSVTPKPIPGSKSGHEVKFREIPGIVKEYPMIRYLIVTGLIPNLLLPIFFYQFSVIANRTFDTEASLISFLSAFRGTTTLLTFVLLFFVGRIYNTMGLTNASLVHPINFSLIFAGLSGFFNIYVAAYGQFSVILIQRAIAGPVNKILYSIVPNHLITWSRSFIRGTVLKIGMLAGSIMMIVLKPVMPPKYFSFFALFFALYWVIETLLFRKHYKRMLKQVIVDRQIDFDQIESVRTFDSGGAAMEHGPVSVEERKEEAAQLDEIRRAPDIEPEVALKLLDDPNKNTRSDAASSFVVSNDIRAVRKLIQLLDDPDYRVRQSAIEALMSYGSRILPYLEVSLMTSGPRVQSGILEVIRLSGLTDFELMRFLGKILSRAYENLIAMRTLDSQDKELRENESVVMLRTRLEQFNEETLSLIFYALWVFHNDMRLMYRALKSESASIAVEMVESSVDRKLSQYLIPLIEEAPINEKIEKGRDLLPLVKGDNLARIMTILANAEDTVTSMLALYAIGAIMPEPCHIPVVESRLDSPVPQIRDMAIFALKRINEEEAEMPEIIEKIKKLRSFTIFEGMGMRELNALASVASEEIYEPNDIIIREGEENSSIYLIVGGDITIYTGYDTAEQEEKVTIGEGAFLGELSLFTSMPANATCVASTKVQAYVIRHHQFQEMMLLYPQIGINMCAFFTSKLRQVSY